MPLALDTLKSALLNALDESSKIEGPPASDPLSIPTKVAKSLAAAYHSYASTTLALPMVSRVVPASLSSLESALTTFKMAGWEPGLIAYWSPVTWTGPGFIPVNPMVVASLSGISSEVERLMSSMSPSVQEFSGKLAGILHKHTVGLQVITTTLSAPPVISPASVS